MCDFEFSTWISKYPFSLLVFPCFGLPFSPPCHALLPLPCNLYGKVYYFITHPLMPQEQNTGQPETWRWGYWPERHTLDRLQKRREKP